MGLGQLLVKQDIVVFILAHKQRQKQTVVKRNLRNPIRQLVIYKRGWEDELGTTENKSS